MRESVVHIGVLGAGRSAGYLIEYLSHFCQQTGRVLKVYDLHFERLLASFQLSDAVELHRAELGNDEVLEAVVADLDLVVSVLPPAMHISVAKACLRNDCHLFTASYLSDEMRVLGQTAADKGLLFMNELGLDPGIDHLSASRLFDHARSEDLRVETFESHCGGLVAMADCVDNPWKYKFTWNPTNVVLAGQGGICVWKEDGKEQRLEGQAVFAHARSIDVPGLGTFDVYPNRNSLTYENLYGLLEAKTLLRGTLRRPGYCGAWNLLVKAGFTESSEKAIETTSNDWFRRVVGVDSTQAWLDRLHAEDKIQYGAHLQFLQLEEGVSGIQIQGKTNAQILEQILLDRWALGALDRDEVVMVHRLGLRTIDGQERVWYSVLQVMGEGGDRTAMAKTVGLPLAMGVETFLTRSMGDCGALVAFDKSWYLPILEKLEKQGIAFKEYYS